MARYKLQGIARDGAGNIIADASVSVYLAGTTTAASVYKASSGGTAVNSVDTDDEGFYELYVDSIDYSLSQNFKITISKSGYTSKTFDEIDIFPGLPDYEIDVSSIYGNSSKNATILNTAITAVGTIDKMIFVLYPGVWTIDTDVTVPSNITLKIPSGALLQISTGITLTINGPFESGLYQVFDCVGTGSVSFSRNNISEVYPEWWCENTVPGTTDMTAAIQASVDSSYSKVKLQKTKYKISSSISLSQGKHLCGSGKGSESMLNGTFINHSGSDPAIVTSYTYGFGLTMIQDLSLYGGWSVNNPNQHGIAFVKSSGNQTAAHVLIDNLYIIAFGGDGIHHSQDGHINNVEIRGSTINHNAGNGLNFQYNGTSAQVNAIWIHHNSISGNKKNGIIFTGNNVVISTNTIQVNGDYGISVGKELVEPAATLFCFSSVIESNYYEGNQSSKSADAAVIGIFSYYKSELPMCLIRNLYIKGNYFGEAGAKYRSIIYMDAVESDQSVNQASVHIQDNYSSKSIIYLGPSSSYPISRGSSISGIVSDSLDSLPKYVHIYPIEIQAYTHPVYDGSWVDYSTSADAIKGIINGTSVNLSGAVKNGTGLITTLPSAWRPSTNHYFIVPTGVTLNTTGVVSLEIDGKLSLVNGDNHRVCINVTYNRQ